MARDRPVASLAELWTLTKRSGQLWHAHFWRLATWFCLGFAVHTVGLLLSAELGATHGTLAMLSFVVGVVATLTALVLMIHTLEPSLRTPTQIQPEASALEQLRIPSQLFVRERSVEVVAAAVGPFLAVYAVWGFVDDQIRDIFASNYAVQGLGSITNFSVSFSPDRLRFYLILAGAAWLLRLVLTALMSRRRLLPLAMVGIILEALWVFGLFAILLIVFRSARAWLRTRSFWVGVQDGWRSLLDWLPDWQLPFGLTVPQAIDRLVHAVIGTVIPGAWQAIALPLVWLALTATVLGWREFRGRDALAGIALREPHWWRPIGMRTQTVAALLTSDLRTKYLPVLQALRIIWRAGPRFLGAYLVLATAVTALQKCFDIVVSLLIGPRDVAVILLTEPFTALACGLLFTTAAIEVYAAGFDRALAAAVAGPVTDETPPADGSGRTTTASAPSGRTGPG